MKHILVAVALVMVCLTPGVSRALPLFSDDFNFEANGLNHSPFNNWTVTGGSVDLIGDFPGPLFDLIPGNGNYVDMDGTTFAGGTIQSTTLPSLSSILPYELAFYVAGSQRDDPSTNTLTYGIDVDGNGILDGTDPFSTITRANFDGFGLVSLPFSPIGDTVVASIIFSHDGADNVGLLLDNVTLTNLLDVPEPASLMLLGAGLAGIGIWRRKATKIG